MKIISLFIFLFISIITILVELYFQSGLGDLLDTIVTTSMDMLLRKINQNQESEEPK